jgi:Na+/proline symporter
VARSLLAFMFIMSALLIHIGISLYAGAAVFQQFFGINVYASIVIISVVTAVYTVVGGLRAVVVTETIQAVILLAGAVVVTLLALFSLPEVGIDSFSALKATRRDMHGTRSSSAIRYSVCGTGAPTRPSSSACSAPVPKKTPSSARCSRAC